VSRRGPSTRQAQARRAAAPVNFSCSRACSALIYRKKHDEQDARTSATSIPDDGAARLHPGYQPTKKPLTRERSTSAARCRRGARPFETKETDMTFVKGQSGNPAGRQPGSRNKRTILAEKLFTEDAEPLWRSATQFAHKGHGVAMKVCIERALPIGRHRPVDFDLRPIANSADALAAQYDIAQAVAEGRLTTSEADDLSRMVLNIGQTATNAALEPRVAELEADAETKRKLAKLRRGG
jgi:hypothetical protein